VVFSPDPSRRSPPADVQFDWNGIGRHTARAGRSAVVAIESSHSPASSRQPTAAAAVSLLGHRAQARDWPGPVGRHQLSATSAIECAVGAAMASHPPSSGSILGSSRRRANPAARQGQGRPLRPGSLSSPRGPGAVGNQNSDAGWQADPRPPTGGEGVWSEQGKLGPAGWPADATGASRWRIQLPGAAAPGSESPRLATPGGPTRSADPPAKGPSCQAGRRRPCSSAAATRSSFLPGALPRGLEGSGIAASDPKPPGERRQLGGHAEGRQRPGRGEGWRGKPPSKTSLRALEGPVSIGIGRVEEVSGPRPRPAGNVAARAAFVPLPVVPQGNWLPQGQGRRRSMGRVAIRGQGTREGESRRHHAHRQGLRRQILPAATDR